MPDGKAFEAKIGRSLERLGGFTHNSNHFPKCDWTNQRDGHPPLLVECKEVQKSEFSIAGNIKANHRKCLTEHTWEGGLAILLLESLDRYRVPIACWGADWLEWLVHEQAIGFEPVILFPLDDTPRPRRKSGSASVWIDDPVRRPKCLVQVPVLPCNRRYDLRPLVESLETRPGRFEGLQALRARYESGQSIFEDHKIAAAIHLAVNKEN